MGVAPPCDPAIDPMAGRGGLDRIQGDPKRDGAMIQRLIGCGVVVVSLAILAMPSPAKAADPATVMQQAMMGLGPLPGATMLQPLNGEQWQEVVAGHAWQMPELSEWPIGKDGRPIVETRQADKMVHTVRAWESLARLRSLYRSSTARLQRLNPDLDLTSLEEGDEVVVWRRDEEAISQSSGKPQAGRLIDGEPMPDSSYYTLQYPHRTFGTYYTVSEVVRVLDAYYDQFRGAAPLVIGDISSRRGGSLAPHRSHQAGRDIDISLPRKDVPPDYDGIHRVWPRNLDVERTLWVMTSFIDGGHVKYIFVDWNHQRRLWQLAKEQGAPQEWLEAVFEYPRRGSAGIIRHSPGHVGHFHVRFYCQSTDDWCR